MELNRQYDVDKCKHLIEGLHFVLHCHHYNTLLHRAITNTPFIDGADFLYSVSRDDFYETLKVILGKKSITSSNDIRSFANDFYKYLGFGEFDLSGLSEKGGVVKARYSHLSVAYMNKWSKQEKPVDDFGRGFIASVWALMFDKKPGKCKVVQTRCMSCGDEHNEFNVEV